MREIKLLRLRRTAGRKGVEVIAAVEFEGEEYDINLSDLSLDHLYEQIQEAEQVINEIPDVQDRLEPVPSEVPDESFVDLLHRVIKTGV